jgi:hypothetical protein
MFIALSLYINQSRTRRVDCTAAAQIEGKPLNLVAVLTVNSVRSILRLEDLRPIGVRRSGVPKRNKVQLLLFVQGIP